MGIITEDLFDLAGVSTTKPVQFVLQEPRSSGAGPTGMVMPLPVTVQPVAGVVTTEDLDPGPATVYLDGHRYEVEIPAVGVTARLRDLIDAGLVTPPSGPSWQSIVAGMIEGASGPVPLLRIEAGGQEPVDTENYVACTYVMPDGTEIAGQFRGRGNSTWTQAKKPWKVRPATATSMFGLPASRNYVLLANYMDDTSIKNSIYFELGKRTTGIDWVPNGLHVEVEVNGEYRGLYWFGEDVRLEPDRLNYTAATGTTGLPLTGAYLMEIDRRYVGAGDPGFTTTRDVMIAYDTPDGETSEHAAYISGWVQNFEDVLFGTDWLHPTNGYAKYIDMPSFVSWYLVNEFLANQDSIFFSSCKILKTRDTATVPGRLHFISLWDADMSYGLLGQTPDEPWTMTGVDDDDATAVWLQRMRLDPAFAAEVASQWAALRANITDTNTGITAWARKLIRNIAKARLVDQDVWFNDWASGGEYRSVHDRLEFLSDWHAQRITFLDDYLDTFGGGAPTPPPAPVSNFTFAAGSGNAVSGSYVLVPQEGGSWGSGAAAGIFEGGIGPASVTDFTVMVDMFVGTDVAGWGTILYLENGDVWFELDASTGRNVYGMGGGGAYEVPGLIKNTWHTLTFVRQGTTARIYINGVGATPGTAVATAWNFSADVRLKGPDGWTGQVDNLRFWNQALTSSQIDGLSNY